MSRIAIIGAGLSGRLLALNLLRFASSDAAVSVRMLDRGDERDMGPAYSYEADYLLLNVPAGAWERDDLSFVRSPMERHCEIVLAGRIRDLAESDHPLVRNPCTS